MTQSPSYRTLAVALIVVSVVLIAASVAALVS